MCPNNNIHHIEDFFALSAILFHTLIFGDYADQDMWMRCYYSDDKAAAIETDVWEPISVGMVISIVSASCHATYSRCAEKTFLRNIVQKRPTTSEYVKLFLRLFFFIFKFPLLVFLVVSFESCVKQVNGNTPSTICVNDTEGMIAEGRHVCSADEPKAVENFLQNE